MMDEGAAADVTLYLVERYWPDVTPEALDKAVVGVVMAAEEVSRRGSPVRHVQSVLAVPEEVVFCLFEACSADAVARANQMSGWPFERVVDALVALPGRVNAGSS